LQEKGKSVYVVSLGIVLFLLSMVSIVPVNAYIVFGSLSAYDVDYWWVNGVSKGDTVLLGIQADTFPYDWHSRLYYSNLTLFNGTDRYDTHIYQFIADKTDDYLLRLTADFDLSFDYNIESNHTISEQPLLTASGNLSPYEVDYWWVNGVSKGDIVLLSIQADTFPYDWQSQLYYYCDLTLLYETDTYDTHIYQFIADKTGDYMLELTAEFSLSFDYTIECTHPISTQPRTHNVAVTNVSTEKTIIFQGQQLRIYVNITNTGSFTETVNVTALQDSTPIQTMVNQELTKCESKTLDFLWSTKGVAAGNYTLSANCTTVENETDTSDNFGIDGVVWIKGDNTPPYIDTPSQNPPRDNVPPGQEVTVSVNVTDAESGVENVTLFYTIDNGTMWENRTMNLNSLPSLYDATIPGQPVGTWVKFKIVANDYAGNNATKDGTEPYCTYQVIPEFPSFLIMPLFMIATLLAVIVYRRKHFTMSKRELTSSACKTCKRYLFLFFESSPAHLFFKKRWLALKLPQL
jgi:hypothetical protein